MTTDSIKSAERTLRVFEYFDRVERPVGVMELSEALQMPRSSTAALVALLVQTGYLSHDRAARSYMPTMKLAQTGLWVAAALIGSDRDRLVPLLHALARHIDETVVLAVQDDLYAQYVHVELAQRPVLYFQRAGARRPMCRSAVGWALLSLQSAGQLHELVQRHNQFAGDKQLEERDVAREVAATRKRGYAFSQHAYLPGVGMIAMPLRSADGTRSYAVGVGGPVERLQEREKAIEAALRGCIEAFLAKAA
ncbi:MAG TPA: IclR family transcriptional regulator C-terminal domain-containing protein [Burkholderiaceae bacterium]|nr:IclR family transcriptional regulator C-terminal domain-containing protein [Burkholderiaceae bacterium]